MFSIARPALIKAKEYKSCGRYIDPNTSFQQILTLYRTTTKLARDPKNDELLQAHAKKTFTNETATLVGLLVLNDRQEAAERVAADAVKELDEPDFKKLLEKAQQGELPVAWP